jgi:peptidyl-prolyl cis-trans isomerase A (cyclophilin A)
VRYLTSISFTLLFLLSISTSAKENPIVVMKTNKGEIHLELFQDKAPKSVKNFLSYVNKNFYNGTIFHRVIDNFMVQGGGFTANLQRKKTDGPIINEAKNGLSNTVGTIAMARTNDINSATSQFFINVRDNTPLNHRGPGANFGYAVFGRVIKGMTVVNTIKKSTTSRNGPFKNMPVENIIITQTTIKK